MITEFKQYYESGKMSSITYRDESGRLNNEDDDPSIRAYYSNGKVMQEEWHVNGQHHREEGPAIIKYWDNCQKREETWLSRGKSHRSDGPCFRKWDKKGKLLGEVWMINGNRITGPSLESLKAKFKLKESFGELGIEDLV